ncbi:MAG: hypothetical protein ACI38Q_05205 [Candidatus Bruticola sp.]
MVAPIGINTNAYSQTNAVRNMQQVGGQSQVTRQADVAPSQSENQHTAAADNVQLSEGVSFAQDAQENATHIGAAQNQFESEIGDTFENAEESEVGAPQSGMTGTSEEAAAPNAPQTDEYGFILMDDQGNPIGGSVPPEDGGSGAPPIDGDGNDAGNVGGVPPENGGAGETQESEAARAARLQKMEQDREEAMSIYTQMMADRQKWFAELMKILTDTQSSIFDIIQQTMTNRAMAFDRAMAGWSRVFNG